MSLWVRFQTYTRSILVLLFVVTLGYDFVAQATQVIDPSDTMPAVEENVGAQKSAKTSVPVAAASPVVPSIDVIPENSNNVVEATLMSQLRQGYRELCAECRIEFKDVKIPAFSPEDVADLKINFQSLKWGGSFVLPVEFLGQQQAYINGQVRLHKRGLQAARAVNALENLHPADIKEEWIDSTFLKDQPATMDDLSGAVTKRFLGIRQTILKSDLRLPQIVSRGQIVKVITGSESFEITSQMRAEDSGSIGEMIRVKSDANKIMSVRISAPGTARLE